MAVGESMAAKTIIAGFGDSLVYGSNLARSWLFQLAERLSTGAVSYAPAWPWVWNVPTNRIGFYYDSEQIRIYNCGIGGNTTAQMLARTSDVSGQTPRPTRVLVWGGINDLFANVPVATVKANLNAIWNGFATGGIAPSLYTIAPVKEGGTLVGERYAEISAKIADVNAFIEQKAAENRWQLVPAHTILSANIGEYIGPDGIHPTQAGYDALAIAHDLSAFAVTDDTNNVYSFFDGGAWVPCIVDSL